MKLYHMSADDLGFILGLINARIDWCVEERETGVNPKLMDQEIARCKDLSNRLKNQFRVMNTKTQKEEVI